MILASTLSIATSRAGCGPAFHFAIVDSSDQVFNVEYVCAVHNWSSPCPVFLPYDKYFRFQVGFTSCMGSHVELWKDGMFVQEWNNTLVAYTTNAPGIYEWQVEAFGNMSPPAMTRTFDVTAELTTPVLAEPASQGLSAGPLVFLPGEQQAYLSCVSSHAILLHAEVLSLDGRVQRLSMHHLVPGENLIQVTLPPSALALALFRLTTSEGVVLSRKMVY